MTSTRLGPVTSIELFFDGGDPWSRPWMATTQLESNSPSSKVHGFALFELWADTPRQVIDDLLAVLDEHAFTISWDLRLWMQDRSQPLGDHESTVAQIAQERGWSYLPPSDGTEADGEIQ